MERYWVEGLFLNKRGVKKGKKGGKAALAERELFAKAFWANSSEEAIRLATEALEGGEWIDRPKVSKTTEEQRMRAMGAPELPGLGAPQKPRRSKK